MDINDNNSHLRTQVTNPTSAISFGGIKVLSDTSGRVVFPQIEASGDNVYTFWGDSTSEVFFRKSSDAGNSFQNVIQLSTGNSSGNYRIAKEGNNVYVVWQFNRSSSSDILFRRSTDSGASFGGTINLGNSTKLNIPLGIEATGNNVYVIWVSYIEDSNGNLDHVEVLFSRSLNNGQTFGSAKLLSEAFNFIVDPSFDAKIAAADNNAYVAFSVGTHDARKTFFTRSLDGGSSFSTAAPIVNSNFTTVGGIAAKGNNVYITLIDKLSETADHVQDNHIEFKRSTDNGKSFESTKDFGPGREPKMDIISNNVYVVWNDSNKVSFRASTNNGSSFGSTKILDSNNFVVSDPQISSSGNAVRIVWAGYPSPIPRDIFFIASGNEGSSFGSTKNISNNGGDSLAPQIISSRGNIYVIWTDSTDNPDPSGSRIFFKKGVD